MDFKQEIKFSSLSFIVLFSLWAMLSGYSEPFSILYGVFSSISVLFIFKRLMNAESTFNKILNDTGKLSFYKLLVNYIPWLVCQVILSSIYVTRKALQARLELKPIVIIKKYEGHNDKSIALFANSVTITPGTLTIDVIKRRKIYICTMCWMDESLKSDVSQMENKVLKVLV
ncbi:Na+/H+ antiporter subunit E [Wolbachia endosymbiont of Cruorifilaria tuberocauda]|uniref:Na+/H+ antiporter subunit E n=1 Tax=Wolbachia endosymbiont of Cruorifilaria tuberocauda TaxID=1812111 RepID=UPI00158B4AEC|nr:Na+/H+ antiporter subunit E [Wolbachia endosymbiont of Cruorifilaria tuberocauda]QKX01457.1 Na+/H+ antiporter subunit E [Wolbachia endosymbiont of Cruorifilaria tuberocauda]